MQLEVVTPKGTVVSTDATEVTAPGLLGEFGALPGHTPFLSALKAGVLSWKVGQGHTSADKGKTQLLAIGPGYAEVTGTDKVVIITRAAIRPEEIVAADLKKELDDVERQLKDAHAQPKNREELEARHAWLEAQLATRALAGTLSPLPTL